MPQSVPPDKSPPSPPTSSPAFASFHCEIPPPGSRSARAASACPIPPLSQSPTGSISHPRSPATPDSAPTISPHQIQSAAIPAASTIHPRVKKRNSRPRINPIVPAPHLDIPDCTKAATSIPTTASNGIDVTATHIRAPRLPGKCDSQTPSPFRSIFILKSPGHSPGSLAVSPPSFSAFTTSSRSRNFHRCTISSSTSCIPRTSNDRASTRFFPR